MLLRADKLGFGRRGRIDSTAARAIARAIEQPGIRAPGRGRRVGNDELETLRRVIEVRDLISSDLISYYRNSINRGKVTGTWMRG